MRSRELMAGVRAAAIDRVRQRGTLAWIAIAQPAHCERAPDLRAARLRGRGCPASLRLGADQELE